MRLRFSMPSPHAGLPASAQFLLTITVFTLLVLLATLLATVLLDALALAAGALLGIELPHVPGGPAPGVGA